MSTSSNEGRQTPQATTSTQGRAQTEPTEGAMQPCRDFSAYMTKYAKRHPKKAALWSFAFGFVVGWKLKPW